MSEPTTKAGRALLNEDLYHHGGGDTGISVDPASILAIEREAAAQERERIRATLIPDGGAFAQHFDTDGVTFIRAVLDAEKPLDKA